MVGLQAIVTDIVSSRPSAGATREFVYLCRNIALIYIRNKVSARRLDLRFFGLEMNDLAFDCIAGLFRRDETGSFSELQTYFERVPLKSSSDSEILALTRRLVYSKVAREVFHLYQLHDPSLGKILRSIKYTVRRSRDIELVKIGGEMWLHIAGQTDVREALPIIPTEFLEIRLSGTLSGSIGLVSIIHEFAAILKEQTEYQPAFPIVGLALVIRGISIVTPVDLSEPTLEFTKAEMTSFLAKSISFVRNGIGARYVRDGKIEAEHIQEYLAVIGDLLRSQFVDDDGNDVSLFTLLGARRTGLTREEYSSQHRVHLEYLFRLTKKDFLARVKDEMMS